MSDYQKKACTKCGEIKPNTPDYFRPVVKGKTWLANECRDCYKKRQRAHHAKRVAAKGGSVRSNTVSDITSGPVEVGDEAKSLCRSCGKWKPRTTDFWRSHVVRGDQSISTCLECYRQQTADAPENKICAQCSRRLPRSHFHVDTGTSDGRRHQCKDCRNDYRAELYDQKQANEPDFQARNARRANDWYYSNYNYAQERNRDHAADSEVKEYRQDYLAELRATDPEFVEANKLRSALWHRANPERHGASVKAWRAKMRVENPQLLKAMEYEHNASRRAHKALAKGSHTIEDILRLQHEQDDLCFYCDADISIGFHVDHFIPLCRGGSNDPENLRLACSPCNGAKWRKMPWVFTPKVRRYRITAKFRAETERNEKDYYQLLMERGVKLPRCATGVLGQPIAALC
jgi:5-methylcytosine-specific restriction endonuclease McrA